MHNNNTESKDTLNYVSLVARYFIFCRIQDNASVNFDSCPALFKTRIDTLKQIALRNKQLDDFYRKWKSFMWAGFFSFICFLFPFFPFFSLFFFRARFIRIPRQFTFCICVLIIAHCKIFCSCDIYTPYSMVLQIIRADILRVA